MNAKSLCLAALLAGGMSPVFATGTATFDSSEVAFFSGDQSSFVSGVDVITFNGLAAGTYDYTLSFAAQYIDDVSADLNGTPVSLNSVGVFTFGSQQDTGSVPFTLTLYGSPEFNGSFAGSMTITGNGNPSDAPEPGTWALMLAGLGFAGVKMRQRRND